MSSLQASLLGRKQRSKGSYVTRLLRGLTAGARQRRSGLTYCDRIEASRKGLLATIQYLRFVTSCDNIDMSQSKGQLQFGHEMNLQSLGTCQNVASAVDVVAPSLGSETCKLADQHAYGQTYKLHKHKQCLASHQ